MFLRAVKSSSEIKMQRSLGRVLFLKERLRKGIQYNQISLSSTKATDDRKHPTSCCPYFSSIQKYGPVQQDDISKDFYMKILNGSLKSVLPGHRTSTKSVVIVGAGLSGLAAAFELQKVGIEPQIIELQNRVGGRTKTLRHGFSTDLHAEGGAMRIPPNHYLTHVYINKFNIPMREFTNYNGNTWLYLDAEKKKIRTKDWEDDNTLHSNDFFPKWDENIPANADIEGILDLYTKTMEPVKKELYHMIKECNCSHEGWERWVDKWSTVSVNEFLRTKKPKARDEIAGYRPWSEAAIRGLQISTYSPGFDISLVEHLRDELGEWWRHKLQTPVNGIDSIAKQFIQPREEIIGNHTAEIDLAKNITFGTKVRKITKENNGVKVSGINVVTGREKIFSADAVIVTVPLTILGQMDIDLPPEQKQAIRYINYGASTKIVLQCKTRFWEKDIGTGGFTKTDLPIGQIHYPSKDNPAGQNQRGLLVCYTWEQDALVFGSQREEDAIESALREVAKIHPEIYEEFEVGMVQAWFSDPSSQGAYAALHPYQYLDGMKTLMTPNHPIYLAGEAISYTNAWMQGALESGLNAAYHLYAHNENPAK